MPVSEVAVPERNDVSTPVLTMKEASQLLHVHANTLRRWNRLGMIKAVRLGTRRDRRFKRDDLLAMMRE